MSMTAIEPSAFWEFLKSRGITFVSGVPDSTFKKTYDHMVVDPEIRYVPAVREDVALGIASAAYFQGEVGAVIMQNSGIGNVVNPLTSFSLMYQVPVLLIVGWRGHGGPRPRWRPRRCGPGRRPSRSGGRSPTAPQLC